MKKDYKLLFFMKNDFCTAEKANEPVLLGCPSNEHLNHEFESLAVVAARMNTNHAELQSLRRSRSPFVNIRYSWLKNFRWFGLVHFEWPWPSG
jgi:hypothetical protein